MADFLKRFGRGAVAGGGGAAQGLLQHLLMQREQERYAGEQAETQKTDALKRLLMQAQIGEIQQEEPEKLTEAGVRGAALQKFLQDPEFEEQYKSGILAKLQPKGEAGKVIGGEKGGFHYFDPESGEMKKILPGRPTTEKPALDPKDVMGMLFNLETQAREEGGPFEGMDVDSAFTELATKAGIPLPGGVKPERSTIMEELMRGGEQRQQQDPEIQKAQQALERGDITQEEFDDFVKERNASYVR